MKSQLYQVLSIIAIGAYFIPILIVLIKKIWYPVAFLLFSLYWLLAGLINVVLLFPGLDVRVSEKIAVIYNMLDMPIVFGIFYFITASAKVQKFAKISAIAFLSLEVVNAAVRGINSEALKYTLAIGLLLVLIIIIWEIVLYLRRLEHREFERGLIFIHAALLFEYGTYIIIYIFDYHLPEFYQRIDNFIIYYASSVIATVIAVCGLFAKDARNNEMPVL